MTRRCRVGSPPQGRGGQTSTGGRRPAAQVSGSQGRKGPDLKASRPLPPREVTRPGLGGLGGHSGLRGQVVSPRWS
ncbi:unnamed protein product [Gulo gulo]|uniref:Uncharacterized protein n=1 Tax=Gulo gulo TaxID=48420 RepID=A0A9X9MA95_GULGU|nr:unnamed protein product [Gulo gulo]